jgi:hypothetical protein
MDVIIEDDAAATRIIRAAFSGAMSLAVPAGGSHG